MPGLQAVVPVYVLATVAKLVLFFLSFFCLGVCLRYVDYLKHFNGKKHQKIVRQTVQSPYVRLLGYLTFAFRESQVVLLLLVNEALNVPLMFAYCHIYRAKTLICRGIGLPSYKLTFFVKLPANVLYLQM